MKTTLKTALIGCVVSLAMVLTGGMALATTCERTITQVTDLAQYGMTIYDPAISNEYAVGSMFDGNDYEIFLFTYGGSQELIQLTDNSYEDWYPQVNDNGAVVWQAEVDNSDFEIFFYDGVTTTQITDNAQEDRFPQINNSGDLVWNIWDGTDYEVVVYDGATATQLTDNLKEDKYPKINNNGEIVWQRMGGQHGPDWEIMVYDGVVATKITANDYDDENPSINDSGEIVWSQYDGTDHEILFYDGATITQISRDDDNVKPDLFPQINNNGEVVWQRKGGRAQDFEIILHDGISETRLTDNAIHDEFPQINENGDITWQGLVDGVSYEVFIWAGIETCDGTDDDCDGLTDEGGVCATTCVPACSAYEYCGETPAVDNDCDGLTDEDLPGDTCQIRCFGDLNADTGVDAADLDLLTVDFGQRFSFFNPCTEGNPCEGDLNCDQSVDVDDMGLFMEEFGVRMPLSNPCPVEPGITEESIMCFPCM